MIGSEHQDQVYFFFSLEFNVKLAACLRTHSSGLAFPFFLFIFISTVIATVVAVSSSVVPSTMIMISVVLRK